MDSLPYIIRPRTAETRKGKCTEPLQETRHQQLECICGAWSSQGFLGQHLIRFVSDDIYIYYVSILQLGVPQLAVRQQKKFGKYFFLLDKLTV